MPFGGSSSAGGRCYVTRLQTVVVTSAQPWSMAPLILGPSAPRGAELQTGPSPTTA